MVDALDECHNNNNIRIIINLLAEARSLETFRLHIFLTSRPEIPIRYGFHKILDTGHRDLVLHNISQEIVDHDIYVFFKYNLKLIGEEHFLDNWPKEKIIRRLVQSANGLFIWAATACRFIQNGLFTDDRMQILLKGSMSIGSPEEHLNELYTTILEKAIKPDISEQEQQIIYGMCRRVLGSIVVLPSPLTIGPLSKLIDIPKQKINQTLQDLHAILDIPKDESRSIRLHHPSFRDFLLDNKRCRDLNFFVKEKQAHQLVANSCIKLLSRSLRQDICSVGAPGTLVTEVGRIRIKKSIPPELKYACLNWVEHTLKSGIGTLDDNLIYEFLQQHFLHWLEALSLMKSLSDGIIMITTLESWLQVSYIHIFFVLITLGTSLLI